MRYGAIAENVAEERTLGAGTAAQALLDASMPLVQAKCIMLAARLGLFEYLHRSPGEARDLAAVLHLDADVLDLVLRVLWSAGYVRLSGRRYELTRFSEVAVLASATAGQGAHIGLLEMFWNAIGRLDDVLRVGTGVDVHDELLSGADWGVYQRAMLEQARIYAPLVARFVPVRPGARRLLDIAGSHGMYGALVCRAHPPLRSTVLELESACEQAMRLAVAEGLDDVVTHRSGDALKDDLGSQNDVVLLCNLLHHLTREECAALIARIKPTMSREGTIAIWEWRPPEDDAPPDLVRDATSLMFRAISRAGCHSVDHYTGWLREAGFGDIAARKSAVTPHHVLVTGRVL